MAPISTKSKIIGVMGAGESSCQTDITLAYDVGREIAQKGWVLLCGGRNQGVMEAAAKGASEHGGTTVGVLPGEDRSEMSMYIQIPIITGMGQARNQINILSSDYVIALANQPGPGTMNEIYLAIKYKKPLILISEGSSENMPLLPLEKVHTVLNAAEAVKKIDELFASVQSGQA